MGLSDVLSGRLPLKCGSTPAECGSESGKVRSKVRVSAVLMPAICKVALNSGRVALKPRQGGSQSPCRWLSRAGVYTERTNCSAWAAVL